MQLILPPVLRLRRRDLDRKTKQGSKLFKVDFFSCVASISNSIKLMLRRPDSHRDTSGSLLSLSEVFANMYSFAYLHIC